LGLGKFDEDDLYAALDDLAARQERVEKALFRDYQRRRGQPPRWSAINMRVPRFVSRFHAAHLSSRYS